MHPWYVSVHSCWKSKNENTTTTKSSTGLNMLRRWERKRGITWQQNTENCSTSCLDTLRSLSIIIILLFVNLYSANSWMTQFSALHTHTKHVILILKPRCLLGAKVFYIYTNTKHFTFTFKPFLSAWVLITYHCGCSRKFVKGNSIAAVSSFTYAKCMLHTRSRFVSHPMD